MRRICKLYVRICRRFAPHRMTYSALAWKRFQETGDSWWRDRIDGAFLFWRGERDHCQSQFARERTNHGN